MTEALVVADDLTGALDAGGQCARHGIASIVADAATAQPREVDAPVAVVSTRSRHCAADEAARRVHEAVTRFVSAGVQRLYKKTDSTLRGNVGAELAACLAASGAQRLVFVPAYPEAGRCTREGVHSVDGVPVADSVYGRDPRAPVQTSHVPSLVAGQCALPVHSGRFRPGVPLPNEGIIIVDAESGGDVSTMAAAVQALDGAVFGGPVGFLGELLRHWYPDGAGRVATPPAGGPVLLVSGSLNPVSTGQCTWAASHGFADVSVDVDTLGDSGQREQAARRIRTGLSTGEDVLLRVVGTAGSAGDTVSSALGELSAAALASAALERPVVLCIFGGDTAHAVLSRVGVSQMRPCAFLGDGLTASAVSGVPAVAAVVTKSGGFGDTDIAGTVRRHAASWRNGGDTG